MISLLLLIALSFVDARVTFEHNTNTVATREFKFRSIAPPSKDDAAAKVDYLVLVGDRQWSMNE